MEYSIVHLWCPGAEGFTGDWSQEVSTRIFICSGQRENGLNMPHRFINLSPSDNRESATSEPMARLKNNMIYLQGLGDEEKVQWSTSKRKEGNDFFGTLVQKGKHMKFYQQAATRVSENETVYGVSKRSLSWRMRDVAKMLEIEGNNNNIIIIIIILITFFLPSHLSAACTT